SERTKVADFYAARDNTMPPLPWPSIAPPITITPPSIFHHLRDTTQKCSESAESD
ncbi:hypothetical protein ACSSV8_003910, partial [Roseovarius sp. MBR-79]